jgi:hypothetical protein
MAEGRITSWVSADGSSDDSALTAVRESINEIERLLNSRNSMPSDILERLVIREYRKIMDTASEMSTLRAGLAVNTGILSQRAAADLLNVHSHTLKRWIDNNPGVLNEARKSFFDPPN